MYPSPGKISQPSGKSTDTLVIKQRRILRHFPFLRLFRISRLDGNLSQPFDSKYSYTYLCHSIKVSCGFSLAGPSGFRISGEKFRAIFKEPRASAASLRRQAHKSLRPHSTDK